VGSLLPLHLGRCLGLKYHERGAIDAAAGLATVEGAIFGLMGLLLAFTISGALRRFDDRQQLGAGRLCCSVAIERVAADLMLVGFATDCYNLQRE
jgi:hypothetical protein